jgi:hypothetical protein
LALSGVDCLNHHGTCTRYVPQVSQSAKMVARMCLQTC